MCRAGRKFIPCALQPKERYMVTLTLLLIASIPNCQTVRGAQSAEAEVQAAVVDSLLVRAGTRQLVIGDSTVKGGYHFVDEDYFTALRFLGALPTGLRADFEIKRGETRRVEDLPVRVPIQRFTAAERALLHDERNPTSFWNAFYRRFPGSSGLVEVSRVGFGQDGKSALVLVEYGCGGRCGGTLYVLLAKQGGRWRVVRTAQPRIS
jgi:hypothetical protein